MDHLIEDLAIVLGVAAVMSVVFRRLGQSPVLGYLFSGLVVGPYIPVPIFADAERIEALSEFGVVLVLFAVGLEFSMRRLVRMLPVAGFTGLVQVCALGGAGFVFGRVLGFTPVEGLFFGACIAISSTMVVSKVFAEHPPEPRVRELVFGVLLVQDLAAILILAGLTAVATGSGLSSDLLMGTLVRLALVLVAMLVGGLLVVPRFVRLAARQQSSEVLLIGAVATCFGLAAVAHRLGYSAALGAFLAGTLVAESGRSRSVEHLVHPVRDMFAAVFFVSVGMSVDPWVAIEHGGLALAAAAIVIVGQFLVIGSAGVLSGNGVRRSITAGLSLGQIGEFSFIMASVGVSAGVVGGFLTPVVVTVAVLTAFTTPLFTRVAERIATAVERRLPRSLQTFATLCESWFDTLRRTRAEPKARSHLRNVALVLGVDVSALVLVWGGVAVGGPLLAERLGPEGISTTATRMTMGGLALVITVPLVAGLLRSSRRAGQLLAERVIPSGASGVDRGLAPRRALVVTLQSMLVLALGLPLVLIAVPILGPGWSVVALVLVTAGLGASFWRSASDLQGHVRAGAAALGDLVTRQMGDEETPEVTPESLLPGLGVIERIRIEAGARAVGRSLAELHLRVETGATILAIHRDELTRSMPAGGEVVLAGDDVIVAGSAAAVAAAVRLLGQPAQEPDAPE